MDTVIMTTVEGIVLSVFLASFIVIFIVALKSVFGNYEDKK